MGDIDEKASRSVSEEEMLYDGVIQGDAELFYIDCYLSELWKRLQETGDGTSEWADFDDFERFMCKYLV